MGLLDIGFLKAFDVVAHSILLKKAHVIQIQ